MTIKLLPAIGFSAAFATMATVAIAGLTAPDAKTTLHASAECPDKAAQPAPTSGRVEAERPA